MLSRNQTRNGERGDTLIEVLFATAVLALIIVIAMAIMNKGTSQTQRAVENTFVRQAIDSQSEILRYQRDAFIDGSANVWSNILANRISSPPSFDQLATNTTCQPAGGQKAFYFKPDSSVAGGYSIATAFESPASFASAGKGLWIEATADGANPNYVDFYIYACWSGVDTSVNATTGTIVRLYAPAQ